MTGAVLDVRIDAKSVCEPGGGPRPILHDVCFSAEPGEFLALFGPSGTGKTTTLRIALGLDADFQGLVRRPEVRVGVVFQMAHQRPTSPPCCSRSSCRAPSSVRHTVAVGCGDEGGCGDGDVDEAMMSEVFMPVGRVELSTMAEEADAFGSTAVTSGVETCTTVVEVDASPMPGVSTPVTEGVVCTGLPAVRPLWPSNPSP